MIFSVVTSFRDFVWPDMVKISQVRCPCCLVTLLGKYEETTPAIVPMSSHGYENYTQWWLSSVVGVICI